MADPNVIFIGDINKILAEEEKVIASDDSETNNTGDSRWEEAIEKFKKEQANNGGGEVIDGRPESDRNNQ